MNNIMNIAQIMANPQAFIQNAMQNAPLMQNPAMKNAMEMYQRGDIQGLQNLANNVAKQQGTTVDNIRKQLGI